MEIIRTFADSGKSGLRLDGRDALKELIAVVETRGDVGNGREDLRPVARARAPERQARVALPERQAFSQFALPSRRRFSAELDGDSAST
jgi:hypothetical protein